MSSLNSPFVDQRRFVDNTDQNAPFTDQRNFPTGGGGGNVEDLEINYDPVTSLLTLSDPAIGNPNISSTAVVPGRVVMIEEQVVQGPNEQSVIALSNSQFPPPPSPKLVGNNPPLVLFPNPITGLTNWFPGASFRATIGGSVDVFNSFDNITLRVYSNRGQPTEAIINQSTITKSFGTSTLGWSWKVNVTCRSINNGATLGTVSTNSVFEYSNNSFLGSNPEGVIVSDVNSSFDTDVTQYLDFTFEFSSLGITPQVQFTTDVFYIERIY